MEEYIQLSLFQPPSIDAPIPKSSNIPPETIGAIWYENKFISVQTKKMITNPQALHWIRERVENMKQDFSDYPVLVKNYNEQIQWVNRQLEIRSK